MSASSQVTHSEHLAIPLWAYANAQQRKELPQHVLFSFDQNNACPCFLVTRLQCCFMLSSLCLTSCRLPSAKPFVLAQRYVSNPLLINNCKFGIRLWLLVTGVDPFTAYLHTQGLVLFSTDR